MDTSNWSIVDVGIDALNVTTNSAEGKALFADLYTGHLQHSEGEGWIQKEGRKGNYSTMSINSMMLGVCPDRGMWLSMMGQGTKALPLSNLMRCASVTRCDLQVTWVLTSKCGGLPNLVYQKLLSEQQSLPSDPYLACIQSSTGSTLYYGKSANGFMGRFYDKGAQSGLADAGWMFRMEWEYRKKQAQSIANALNARGWALDAIRDTVLVAAEKRGIPVPAVCTAVQAEVDWSKEQPDVVRKLNWLATQVAPTLDELIDLGYGVEANNALWGRRQHEVRRRDRSDSDSYGQHQ